MARNSDFGDSYRYLSVSSSGFLPIMSVVLIVNTIAWLQIQLIYFMHQKSQPKSTLLLGFGWLFICDIPIFFFQDDGSVLSIVSGSCLLRLTTLHVFLTLHVRMKNGISRWFCSWPITSGNCQPSFPAFWGTSRYLFAASSLCFALPVFPICHIRMNNGLWSTFSSRSVTSGNHEHAFQTLLWHFMLFLICHIRSKNGLPRTLSSWSVTSGNHQWALASNVMEPYPKSSRSTRSEGISLRIPYTPILKYRRPVGQ